MIIRVHEAVSGNDTLIDMPAGEIFSQGMEAIEGSFAGMEPDKEVELNNCRGDADDAGEKR